MIHQFKYFMYIINKCYFSLIKLINRDCRTDNKYKIKQVGTYFKQKVNNHKTTNNKKINVNE